MKGGKIEMPITEKYGLMDEVSNSKMIWKNKKRIESQFFSKS